MTTLGVFSAKLFLVLDSFLWFVPAYDDASAEARAEEGDTAGGDGGGFAVDTEMDACDPPAVTGGGRGTPPARRPCFAEFPVWTAGS
jgi:hypothetical protein